MGNLSIAFDDPLGDLFFNPAKASSLTGLVLFTSPTRNSWSNDDNRPVITALGSSRYPGASVTSIPFGGFLGSDDIFAGGLIAHQAYRAESSFGQPSVVPAGILQNETKNAIGNNTYLFGLFGTRILERNLSIAGSLSWARYNAMDGVDLLYPGSVDLTQEGWTLESKVGAIGRLNERDRLEFVLGWSILKATHLVTYPNTIFIKQAPTFLYRTEINKDESDEWLLQASYKHAMARGWVLGVSITVNWKEHPKIPNYDLANIPRDPGTSVAYNLGFGAVWSDPKSSWGIEYIYEPIATNTWAEAGEQPREPTNLLLPPHFKTIQNFFDFTNHIIRAGYSSHTKLPWLEYRFGAQLHIYRYSLEQQNNVTHTRRSLSTDWVETTLSGGMSATIADLRLIYTLQLVFGNGLVGTEGTAIPFAATASANDILVAPTGNLVVNDITLVTHQLALVYNIP
jgi:hypothetical protein